MGQTEATPAVAPGLVLFYDTPLWAPNEGHSHFMAPSAITPQLIAAQLVSGLPGCRAPSNAQHLAPARATRRGGFRCRGALGICGARLCPCSWQSGCHGGEGRLRWPCSPARCATPGVGTQHVGSASGAVEGSSPGRDAAVAEPCRGGSKGRPPLLAGARGAVISPPAPGPAQRRVGLQRSRRSGAGCRSRGSGPVPSQLPPRAPGGAGGAAVTRARPYKVPAPGAAAAERDRSEPGAVPALPIMGPPCGARQR